MAQTTTKQGGHDVVVRTSQGYSSGDTRRETFVDGKCESISYQRADGTTREAREVHHGILGPTPKGGYK